jgi:Bacterial SH3 domain
MHHPAMRLLFLSVVLLARTAVAQDAPLYNAAHAAAIRPAPGDATSPSVGQVNRGSTVEVLARDRGWVRVRLEGWVRESDLIVADSSLRPLSAADIRSDPAGTQGKLVRWEVQAISLQTADALRTGLSPGEPYLLALGPGAEKTLVYLAVPPGLLPSARNLPAMANVVIVARVRNGKSEPAGVPVLDLQSLTRQ